MYVLYVLFLICSIQCYSSEARFKCSHTDPCALTGGETFRYPTEYRSTGGEMDVELVVDVATVRYDWLRLQRRTYNGEIPGPTLRIRPGDKVTVRLINDLTDNGREEGEINSYRFANVTNLHTHGLHIGSQEPQDNVFVDVKPGEQYIYEYEIDSDNPSGTYWYHAHVHGSTMFQVQGGLAGLIIIEDPMEGPRKPPQHLEKISCPNNCQHDVYFVFQPILQYADKSGLFRGFSQLQNSNNDYIGFKHTCNISTGGTLADWLTDPENDIDHITVNGQLFPELAIRAGQRKRFRMVNAGGSKTLEVLIAAQGSKDPTPDCSVFEIAYDGIYLNEARKQRLGKSLLVPATRVDWIVVCDEPGTYELRSVVDERDHDSIGNFERHDGLLVTIKVVGTPAVRVRQELTLPKRPMFVTDFRHLSDDDVNGRFVIEANSRQHLNREKFKDEFDYRFKAEVDTVQEWYLTNTDPGYGHPIHIHVNHFQVISYNKYTGPFSVSDSDSALLMYSKWGNKCHKQGPDFRESSKSAPWRWERPAYVNHKRRSRVGGAGTLGYAKPGEFRDVLLVPPLSNITIRFLAHKYTGTVLTHCHILVHEDFGMMMTEEIVKKGGSLELNPAPGDFNTAQCRRRDPYPFNQVVVL